MRLFVTILFLASNFFCYSQQKTDLIGDSLLHDKLYSYLDKHREAYAQDTLGHRIYLEDDKYIGIFAWDLKIDSIITNKDLPGIYACKFASFSEKPYLYINYGSKIEFLKIDSTDASLKKIMQKITRFMSRHNKYFTFAEKIKVIQNTSDILRRNLYFCRLDILVPSHWRGS